MAKYKHNPSLLMAVPELGTVKDLVTNNNFTITGGVGTGFTEPSNYRTVLGVEAPVLSGATDNLVNDNDALVLNTIGAWGTLVNCTLAASTLAPWGGYSYSGKLTVTADGVASATLDVTAVTANAQETASVWFKGTAGRKYLISLVGNSSGTTSATAVTATGDYQRITLTKAFAADTTRTMLIQCDTDAKAGDIVYWSAVQIESGATATNFCLGARVASSAAITCPVAAGGAFSALFALKKLSTLTTETIVDCRTAGNGWRVICRDGRLLLEVSNGTTGKAQYATIPATADPMFYVTRNASGAMDIGYAGSATSQTAHALGSGNDQFYYPYGVCSDGTYIYVVDRNNHRIVKRLASDLSYVAKIGSLGTGNDQFSYPYGICSDGTYIYVADANNHRIVKRLSADSLAFDSFSPLGSGLETAVGALAFGAIGGAELCAVWNRVLTTQEITDLSAMTEWGELATLEAPLVAPEPIELKSAYSVKAEIGDTLRFVTMNHSLSGGTDYGVLLDLNDDGVYCASRIEYPPPAPRIEYRDPAHIDGREVSFHKYENRELTLTLNIFGADKEDLSNNVHELWQLLTGDNPILEWKPEGWTKGLYFDLIAPPLQFNVSDWFEAPTHRWHKDVMSNVEIVIEAKPFARGAEETVTLLDGNGSPSIPACTGIVVPPEAFKGDHPAPADIFIDRVGGELWTDLIFGQRIEYSEDFDPIQNMSVGDSQVTPAVGRLEDDYWVLDTGTNLVTNGGFEDGSTGWTFYSPLSVRVISTPAYVFEGTKALKLYGSHHYTDAAIATSARIPIDPTKPYILTLRYMGDADAMFTVAALSGTTLPSATQIYYNAFGGLPSQYAKLTKYFPVGSFAPTDDSLWIRLYHDNWTDNVNSSSYVDNVEVLEAGPGVFIQAEYGVASHAGRYLPTASVSFGKAEDYDAVTINYIVADKAGVPITEQVQGATVDSGNPNTNFHDVAFLPSRFSAITIPSHRVSDFADKTEFLQQLRLETDSRTTADFWYDYVGIVPIDRGYTEVRNWDGNEHLILDSRSSRMPLTSRSGTYDDAMVYDLEKTKGECSFVADPQGFNGAILAVTNKDGDHQILSYVNVKMVYSPLYLIVPEK